MIKKTYTRWKIYADRCRMYQIHLQFIMLAFLFVKDIPILWNPISRYPYIAVPLLLIIFVVVSIIVGWIDNKLGLMQEEQERIAKLNPVLMEIKKDIEEIRKCLTK